MTTFNRFLEQFSKLGAEQYVYHLKSPQFKGKFIYSLSDLAEIDPKSYRKELSKYKDRPGHLEQKIDVLNCTQADVINLSCLNPVKLFKLFILLDVEKFDDKEIIKIPISSLSGDAALMTFKGNKVVYKKQSLKTYKEETEAPFKTALHYIESKQKHESPLIFEYVPHLLVKCKIDISGCEVIKFTADDL